jgi:hypothetical protein
LSHPTKTDDLSRFFRDPSAGAPGPFGSHVEDNQTEKGDRMLRTIRLPALGRTVSLADYNQAVRLAKAFPSAVFKTGLTTWWPTTGAEILQQFREGMTDRINQAIPYSQRGRK